LTKNNYVNQYIIILLCFEMTLVPHLWPFQISIGGMNYYYYYYYSGGAFAITGKPHPLPHPPSDDDKVGTGLGREYYCAVHPRSSLPCGLGRAPYDPRMLLTYGLWSCLLFSTTFQKKTCFGAS
jgi:hypothetical protein